MIKTLYFMFFVGIALIGLIACTPKLQENFKNLNADEFENFIQGDSVQIVDVRTVAEYSEGHLPGSINLNVLDEQFAANADDLLDPNLSIAVYCKSGRRSRNAARMLTKKGFHVVNLDKGYLDWVELGKPIEK